MDTNVSLVITFPTTPRQKELIKDFCKNKLGSDFVIAIKQSIGTRYMLSFSVFENRPTIYIGLFSMETRSIVTDAELSDEEIQLALYGLDYKYAHATSRKSPLVNYDLANAWIDYINSNHSKEKIPLN